MIERIPARVRRVIVIVLRVVVAAVFVAAAIPKLQDPAAFASDIDNYRLVPDALVGPMAVALPVLELVVAAALVSGVHAAGGAVVAMGLLAVFVVGMAQAMARGIDLDCGCFGSEVESRVSAKTIAQDVVLLLACVPIVLARPAPRASEPPVRER